MKAAGFVYAVLLALAAVALAEDSRIRCYNRKFSSGSEAAILCIYPLGAEDESDSRQDNDLYDFSARAEEHMPQSSWLSSPVSSPPPMVAWRRTLRNKGPSSAGGGQGSSFLNVNFPNSGRLLPRLY